MAISKVTTSNTNTINKVVVTDSDAISIITVGTQGLSGAATLLGKTVEAETVGSSDAGSTVIYDHANSRWLATTSSNATSLTTKLRALVFSAGGASVTQVLDEDNLGSNSNTSLATQQSIKAYVDAQITAQDFDFQGDSGGALSIDLDSETMTFTGGTGIDTSGSGNTVTFSIDSTVATLTGSQTLTNKTLTSPVLNTVDINGGDISSGTTINKSPEITLAGDLSGSVTLTNLADGTLTATIAANSVALGTDTTGNYVATVAASNGGIDVANSGSESAAVTVGLNSEFVQDIVGAMFTGNTETNITATYQDSDGTIDLVIGTLNQDTTGNAATATALATARTIHGVSFDGTANIDLTEVVQDTVGAMFSSNTETNITVTYEDSDGTIDLVIGTLNQDTTGNAATATALQTARTIHGVSFDGSANIDLSEVIQDTVGAMFSSNTETNITATYEDSDGTIDLVVDTSSVTETLTNKTITNPTISDPEFSGTLLTAPSEATTQTLTVTVASKTSEHPYDSGSGNAYVIDGVEAPYITLTPDTTYRFDQSDSSNGGHPLRFYYEADKTTAFTTGVTTNGTAGSAGAYTEIKATADTPTVLFYQCSAHALMGNRVNFDTRNFTGFDTDDLSEGSTNLYVTNERIQDIVGGMVSGNTETGITVSYEDSDGTLDFAVGNATTATALETGRTIALSGDVTATGVSFDGSANITLSTTIAANSVALGTDTTGNYVAAIAGTSNEIEVSGSGSETATVTIGLPDDVIIGNDLTVTGDLTVNGDTVTLNTATLDVEDATIRVAKGATSLANTNGAGIEFGASSSKPTILWDNGNSRLSANKPFAASSFIGALTGNASTATSLETARTISGVSFDGSANITLDTDDIGEGSSNLYHTTERVQDIVGAMFSSNTETGIAATYEDSDGTIDLVIGSGVITNDMLAGSIANAKLANSAITVSDGSNSTATALGGTITFSAGEGIDVTESSGTITIAAEEATASNKGVASFTNNFSVSSGAVSLADSGVSAASYGSATAVPVITVDAKGRITAASTAGISTSFTLSDGSNTQTVSGGDTLTVAGTSNEVDVAVSATDTLTIGLPNDVTVSNNLTVSGNLTVTGTTTQTGSVVTDNNFTGLANANTGNSTDFGFYGKYVESSTTKYAGIYYDASVDNTFRLFVDTQTVPSTTVNTSASGYAAGNLIVGALTASGITIGSTAVTATAEELNILDGVTATASEINVLDGITAVVGELNALDLGSTAIGTAIASKAVVLDANKDYTGIRNLTVTGELDGASLDISGNADIDGTLEADAITVNGTALDEFISDTVGAMVSSNTESGITVTYDDSDNTLDFTVGTLNQDTTGTAALATSVTISANNSTDETIFPVFVDGATGTQGLETDTGFTYNPSTGLLTATGFAGTLQTAAQTNITSVGTLSALSVSGDLAVDTNVLKVDTSNNRVGIKQASPTVSLDIGQATDAILLPKGTTAQRPSAEAGQFRYNTTLGRFEGYTDAWGEVGGAGTSTLSVNTFTANGSTTAFTLSQAPDSEDNILVFVEGVFMNANDFVLNGTTLTLDEAPPNGRKITVYHVTAAVAGTGVHQNSFTGDGSTTAFTLGVNAVSENNTQVYIDGVYQNKATYSTSGTTLTFDTAPANSAAIEAMTFTQTDINTFPASGISGLTEVTPVAGDHVMILDATDNALKKADVKDLMETSVGITSSADAVVMTFDVNENVTFTGDIKTTGTKKIEFGDSGTFIHQSADGVLDLVSDNEIEINATTVDVNGALDVSGNITGTLATAAQTNITSLGTLTALTVDDITIDGSTISDGATMTLDAGSQIVLDADGGLIQLKDGGTEFAQLKNSSSDLQIISIVDDKDIIFRGSDNGTYFNALTLDMSEAGKATFNDAVVADSFETTAGGTFTTASGNDLNIVYPDTRSLFIKEGSQTHVTVDNTGKVGLGEPTPLASLHIKKGDSGLSSLNAAGDHIFLENTGANGTGITLASGNTSNGSIIFGDEDSNYRGVLIYDHSADAMKFVTAAQEAMRIDSSNRLLIGETSNNDGAAVQIDANNAGSTVYSLRIENSNTATDVYNGIRLIQGASGSAVGVMATGGSTTGNVHYRNVFHVGTQNATSLVLGTDDTERARIDTSGRLCVNTTSAINNAHTFQTTNSGNNVAVFNNTVTSGNPYGIQLRYSGVGSGTGGDAYTYYTQSSGSYELKFAVRATGNVVNANNSYGQVSDRKLKENIVDATDKLDELKQIKIRNFNFIGDDTKQIGVVAQELETIFPALITDRADVDADGNELGTTTKEVKYSVLLPIVIKAMQEQQALIEALQKEVEELKGG